MVGGSRLSSFVVYLPAQGSRCICAHSQGTPWKPLPNGQWPEQCGSFICCPEECVLRGIRYFDRSAIVRLAVLSAALWTLGACSMGPMLLSQPVLLDLPNQPQEAGMVYRLPKTVITLTISSYGKVKAGDKEGAGIAVPEVVLIDSATTREIADSRYAYSLQYSPSVTSNDRVCMGVSPGGLLQSVEGAADDKTGDIAIAVAKLAGRLAGPGAFGLTKETEDLGPGAIQKLRTMTIEIDPLDERQWQLVHTAMRATLGHIADKYQFGVADMATLVGAASPKSCPLNSVCYRTRVPAQLFLARKRGNEYQVTSSIFRDVVSQKITAHIDVSRALMVEKITRLSFKDGTLLAVNIRKPSEGLAVAKLPLTVLDAITTSALAAPGNFIAKASGSTATADLLKQSADNATQIALLQQKLSEIREGDFSKTPETANAPDAFQLKCTTPNAAVVAAN